MKPAKPEPIKLTKRDRRILSLRRAKEIFKKLLHAGWKGWQPGEIITTSDRSYLVREDGSWKRLVPGEVILIRKTPFEVNADGKTFRRLA